MGDVMVCMVVQDITLVLAASYGTPLCQQAIEKLIYFH